MNKSINISSMFNATHSYDRKNKAVIFMQLISLKGAFFMFCFLPSNRYFHGTNGKEVHCYCKTESVQEMHAAFSTKSKIIACVT